MSSKVRCAFCKEYIPKAGAIRDKVQSFCSPEHRMAKANQKPKPKSNEPSADLKQQVRELDGNRCRFCGRGGFLHVHHIVYRSQGGKHEVGNLITLCDEHHGTVHSDKSVYAPLCEMIVLLRTDVGDKLTTINELQRKL